MSGRRLSQPRAAPLSPPGASSPLRDGAVSAAAPRGRHRIAPPGRIRALVAEHGTRFASFSVVGGFVFVLGLALQAFLVQICRLGSDVSYLLQGFVSVQVSFLLNYFWTWRDVQVRFWRACYKFNLQKIITTVFNLLVYAGLIAAGINYLVANIATTAVFTAVNYVFGNRWAFVPSERKKNCPPPSA
jgi:putative flippase GtrA